MRTLVTSTIVVCGFALCSPHAALAAAPSAATLRLRTGTLGLSSSGAGRAPAVLRWTQGASSTPGVGCCTNEIYDGQGAFLGQTTGGSWQLALRESSVYTFRIDAYDRRGTYVGTAFSDPPGYFDGYGISGPGAFTYTDGWHRQSLSGSWGGSVEYSTAAGATATIHLGCRAFGLVMTKGPAYGSARVTVDGASTTINLHAATRTTRQIVLVRNYAEDPAEPSPAITITNLGTKGHSRVDVNAVEAIEID